jgi:hypothetical protein
VLRRRSAVEIELPAVAERISIVEKARQFGTIESVRRISRQSS